MARNTPAYFAPSAHNGAVGATFDQRLSVFVENPFSTGRTPPSADDARSWLALTEGGQALRWAEGRPASELERLLLSAAHAQALGGARPAQLLIGRGWTSMLTRAGLQRAQIIRVALAAQRAQVAFARLHGSSDAMQAVRTEVWYACFGRSLWHTLKFEHVIHDHDVLITGETGTGKEAIANVIARGHLAAHDGRDAPYAAINAAAVPETLIESELFGHVKGAFTGAHQDRQGRLRSAHAGCFFLDEIGDLPLPAQAKLLRVMEENRVTPIGSDLEVHVDVRYLGATHLDLEARVRAGSFRADLYQRIAGRVIHLPALRERPEDIGAIGAAFVARATAGEPSLEHERARALALLESAVFRGYAWPGNVRELENVLRDVLLGLSPRAVAKATEPELRGSDGDKPFVMPAALVQGLATLAAAERWYMRHVLHSHGDNHTRAARALGIDRSTLRRRLLRD